MSGPTFYRWRTQRKKPKEFDTLLKFFLKAEEKELGKELEPTLDSLLDELEQQHGGTKFQRAGPALMLIPLTP